MPRLASPPLVHSPRLSRGLNRSSLGALTVVLSAVGCGGFHNPGPSTLRLSEVMASNDGAYLDEQGEAEDFVELVNMGDEPIDLSDFSLNDSGDRGRLPSRIIPPGGLVVLFADDETEQGELHLDFKLSAGGETLSLVYHGAGGRRGVDEVTWTELQPNEAYGRYGAGDEWVRCTWASPMRPNGARCGPPEPPPVPPDDVFADYTWPAPTTTTPLTLSELALSPAAFIEVRNTSGAALPLTGYQVRIAPHGPNQPWPGPTEGVGVALMGSLAAGERATVTVTATDVAGLALPLFEGVVSLFALDGTLVDRIDFMRWPVGNALARAETPAGTWRFVTANTPAAANTAPVLASRDVGTYVRHLFTPGDYAALARGGTLLDQQAVKFLLDVDVVGGPLGYLMSSDDFPLHFDFVDQLFAGGPVFDRCDAAMNAEHRARWTAFSVAEYYCGETQPAEELQCTDAQRRFMMGTLVHHVGPDLHTIEMVSGDRASASQMVTTFFTGAALSDDPTRYVFRPQSQTAVDRLRTVEGQLPIIGRNAPFVGVTEQPLNPGVAYGTLTFVPNNELATAVLGPRVVLVTDSVPNDIGFVGGLVTEALQTPLAHVNVLSQNRGTPNLAVVGARNRSEFEPLFGELVRLEVTESGFTVRVAELAEAQAHWESIMPPGPPQSPARDITVRGIQDLADRDYSDIPSIGGKAAQFAELYRVTFPVGCGQVALVPDRAFAIPMAHYVDHFQASGAQALLTTAMNDARFESDALFRRAALASVREAITEHPVDAALLTSLEQAIQSRWGSDRRVRLRSSSNTEDLPGFNGAGLYVSEAAQLSEAGTLASALRTVWASLWTDRAHDERAFFRIEPTMVAMGVLVHAAFVSEEASGIVVSRSLHDPTRSDIYTMNFQRGEASVANPAPGITSEQFDYRWSRTPRRVFRSYSTFSPDTPLTSEDETCAAAVAVRAIHDHFQMLVDPQNENQYFAMEVELKFLDGTRQLYVKQARPYPFQAELLPADCRGF